MPAVSLALVTATAFFFAQIPAQTGSTFKVIKRAKKKTDPADKDTEESPERPSTAASPDAPPPAAPPPPPAAAPSASSGASEDPPPLPSLSTPPPPPPPPAVTPTRPAPAAEPAAEGTRKPGHQRVVPWLTLVGGGLLAVGGVVMALRLSDSLADTGDIEIEFDEPVQAGSTVDLPDELEDNQREVVIGAVVTTVLLSAAAAALVTGLTLLFDD